MNETPTPWLKQYLNDSLLESPGYQIDISDAVIKLDQNESPLDWPDDLKEKVFRRMTNKPWNRYPTAHAPAISALMSKYLGVPEDRLLTSVGSDHLIVLILQLFSAKMPGKLMVARPSFPLYEAHCRYFNIPYTPWHLTADLQYDLNALENLPKGSFVVFASPNNPAGNSLAYDDLDRLLTNHPDSLFLADEAYYEFAKRPYTPLLEKHHNIIIVRTFSKVMSAAGIRLGYVLARPEVITQLKKPRLPYILNEFTVSAMEVLLNEPLAIAKFQNSVKDIVEQRETLISQMHPLVTKLGFRIFPSQANFILLRWPTQESCNQAYGTLMRNGIQVRNVSKAPGLAGCMRVTVGTASQNAKFMEVLKAL